MARHDVEKSDRPVGSATVSMYNEYGKVVMPVLQQNERPEYVCGWSAAFINISVTFPINKIMFRQQLYGVRTFRAIRQMQKEGLGQLYRGLLPPLLQKTTSIALMFGLYHDFQRKITHYAPSMWLPLNKTMAAMLAGTVESVLTPFERIQVLMQDKTHSHRFNNTYHAYRELKVNYGFREFYRGQVAILIRNGPSNVLFFLGRDYLRMSYPSHDSTSSKVLFDFISGALLGAFISTIFYPVNVIKVHMQSEIGGEFVGFFSMSKTVWIERNRSMKKLFRGVHVNYTRALISWGVLNATYEFLMKHMFDHDVSDGWQ